MMTQELLDTDPETSPPGSQVYGFPPACFPGVPDFASGTTITLNMGQRFHADIRLARQAYYPVAIPVLNADSPGLNVTVSAQAHPGPGYSLGYNAGTHRIEGLLPNGTYLIQAKSYGPASASGQVSITISGPRLQAPDLVLNTGGVIPIEVHEEFTSEWHGYASYWNGKRRFDVRTGPWTYLRVWLEPLEDFSPTNERPSLRFPASPQDPPVLEGVSPGRYWVRYSSSHGYVQSLTSNETDLLREPLVVLAGSPAKIDLTMRDDMTQISGSVAGVRAVSDENSSIHGEFFADSPAYIYCVPLADSAGTYQEFSAQADGTFLGIEIAPGTYRVLAFSHRKPNLPYRDATAMRAYEDQGQVVTLVPGQTERLQLQLSSGD